MHTENTIFGYVCGLTGGFIGKLMDANTAKTIMLALFCGFLGTIGKNAGSVVWKWATYNGKKTIANFKNRKRIKK